MSSRAISASKDSNGRKKNYSVDLTLRGSSFGIGLRSSVLSMQGRDTPSPFIYHPVYNESPYKGVRLKGYSSDLKIIKRLQSLPGPGSYDPYEPLGSGAPKVTIKPRLTNNSPSVTPAPNAYFPDHKKVLKNSPIYSIPLGIRSKHIKDKGEVNPGPGAYTLPKVI